MSKMNSNTEISCEVKGYCHDFFETILKNYDPSCKLIRSQVCKRTVPGDNYMSTIDSVTLTLEKENVDETENMSTLENKSFILKTLPLNPSIRKYMEELKAFEKEIVMFNQVFPVLVQDIHYDSLPLCIYAGNEGPNGKEYIVLEDLKADGYKMADRIQGLDFNHAVLAISEIAKFHALSFIKFKGNGERILESFPNLVDMFWLRSDQVSERNKSFISGQLSGIKRVMIEENCEHLISRIEGLFNGVFDRMHRLASVSRNYPSVINFGDCWTNNMMFKYDDKGNVTKVKFLDFQLSRVVSRCSDLAYLLYTSVHLPTLNEKLTDLLRVYHDTFNSFLSSNSKPGTRLHFQEQQLSWEYFNMEFEHYRSHGTTLALIYTPLMLPSFDTVPDLEKTDGNELVNMGNATNEGVNNRNAFTNVWKCQSVRDKLIAIASGHLPMCFKPAQS